MSHSPATPEKPRVVANRPETKAPLPSSEMLTSTSKVKQASLNEPSPASTYGDTIAGDSPPATPLDVGSHGKCMCSFPALQFPRSIVRLASGVNVLLGLDTICLLLGLEKLPSAPYP